MNSIPFTHQSYCPELDSTDFCDEKHITLYQNLIGMLRWACELGRIDVLHKTSLLSQYLAKPRVGHLYQSVSVFEYLAKFDRYWLVMNPTTFDIIWEPTGDEPSPEYRAKILKEMYPDANDELPHNMPEPLGGAIDLNVFVDADHAGNRITRRSHTGILIYCNSTAVMWFSKRQNTVETSTFSSKIVALKIAVEMAEGLCYKLCMFGIPIRGPAHFFCDNLSVVTNTLFPESALKKKHCSVAHAKIRASIAAGISLVYYENTENNVADLLTKVLSFVKRSKLIKSILD